MPSQGSGVVRRPPAAAHRAVPGPRACSPASDRFAAASRLGSRGDRVDLVNVADFERVAAEKLERRRARLLRRRRRRRGDAARQRRRLGALAAAAADAGRQPELGARCELLGGELSMPILVAPVAFQRMVDPEGEVAMARAAAAAGTAMCLSTLATSLPAEVAEAAPAGRHLFQLYCFSDEGVTRALMDQAVASGFEAILVTVDAPRAGNRERDRRTGFVLPEGLGIPSVAAALGAERAVTRPRGLRADRPLPRLARPRGARLRLRAADPGQGDPHRRGRGAGDRARRRRHRRLQPRRAPARPRRRHRRRPRGGGRGRRRPRHGARRRRHPARRRRRDRPRPRRRRGPGRAARPLGPRGRRRGGRAAGARDPARRARAGPAALRLRLGRRTSAAPTCRGRNSPRWRSGSPETNR